MKVLGVVPARSGSKGVPGKNTRLLCGKPLLQYTAEAARSARWLNRVVLSTDSEEIAEVGRRCGLEVPFLRPVELAQDSTPMLPVVQHVVQSLEARGESYDAICLLQPTSPLRTSQDIDACLEMLKIERADSVISVLPVPHEFNPHWVYRRDGEGCLRLFTGEPDPIPRRQELPDVYYRDGSVFVTRRDVLIEQNSLYGRCVLGYVGDPGRSIQIDTVDDWDRVEQVLYQAGNTDK